VIVAADSSPFIVLVNIGEIEILPALFGEVFVPPQVITELRRTFRPLAVQEFARAKPVWLRIQEPKQIEAIPRLDEGELAAISLARELNAGLLLIDEKQGRSAALARQLRYTGTIGVLERAAAQGMVDLAEVYSRLKATDFWIKHHLLDDSLRRFRRNQTG
jgi:predicted nucleic acid-binding protein